MTEVFEFYCNDCDGWIIVNLNVDVDGEYVVVCPSCGRQHPREIIKKDMIQSTDEVKINGKTKVCIRRGHINDQCSNRIIPVKSAYSKTSRIAQFNGRGGILAERWLEKTEKEKIGHD